MEKEILEILKNIQSDMTEMKGEISGIKGEISGIKGEISEIKGEITGIKSDMSGMSRKNRRKELVRHNNSQGSQIINYPALTNTNGISTPNSESI